MMTRGGLKTEEAWNKTLTFAKAIFLRIHEVRVVSRDLTPGAMLFGMLRTCSLLEEYAALSWVRHSDVSSALTIAAIQREASVEQTIVKKFEERFKALDSVVTKANKAATDIKNLVSKNDLKM